MPESVLEGECRGGERRKGGVAFEPRRLFIGPSLCWLLFHISYAANSSFHPFLKSQKQNSMG